MKNVQKFIHWYLKLLLNHRIVVMSIVTLVFGIAIDDTVHLISWVDKQLKRGCTMPIAIKSALENCSPAMIITSLMFTLGFGVFIFSSFSNLVLLSILGAAALITALAADLFMTPTIMLLSGNWRKK